jgi:glycolate oxidase FAD binding subunit
VFAVYYSGGLHEPQTPKTPEQLAEALGQAGSGERTVRLGGHFSKNAMAGPAAEAEVSISTCALRGVRQYDPRDLTISVEAGLPWRELTRLLAGNRQMVPLDPPFASEATVGGVVATNSSGPRRRLYGTARDLIIGMQFATLEGKLVQSGGMVVKNVAGLDMAKLLVGSFGTLAAITVVNFKLAPMPSMERSFLLEFDTLESAVAARDALLKSPLQPSALDLLSPDSAEELGKRAWMLAIQAGGSGRVIERYEREVSAIGSGIALEGPDEAELWAHIQELIPRYLASHPDGAVVRVSSTLRDLGPMIRSGGFALARAGSGVAYLCYPDSGEAARQSREAAQKGWKSVVEFSPGGRIQPSDLWPEPGADLETMKRVKRMFDPLCLLNRGRLYGRI